MIDIIRLENRDKWDKIVKSFNNYDIYYLSGYLKAFQLHGDGDPILIYFYYKDGSRGICVLMLRDIANDPRFMNKIPQGEFFDAVTPYGYGGFLIDGEIDDNKLSKEFKELLQNNNIISVFYRFHPVLSNAKSLPGLLEVVPLGKTIAIDLASPDIIWENIISKNRNMIRKAEKMGVVIHHGKGPELLREFRDIYNSTMDHDNADDYYYFGEDFYKSIDGDLSNNYEIFYAVYQDQIIAMAIMIYANRYMAYHLSGSKYEFRHLAPSNLLLYKASLWGTENGLKILHLGGGLGSSEDNLYKFKAAFNRNSDYRFAIGKSIINHDAYNYLINLRASFDDGFNSESRFFPAYRS